MTRTLWISTRPSSICELQPLSELTDTGLEQGWNEVAPSPGPPRPPAPRHHGIGTGAAFVVHLDRFSQCVY